MFSCFASIRGAMAVFIPHKVPLSSRNDASPRCASCSSIGSSAAIMSAQVLTRSGTTTFQSISLPCPGEPYASALFLTLLITSCSRFTRQSFSSLQSSSHVDIFHQARSGAAIHAVCSHTTLSPNVCGPFLSLCSLVHSPCTPCMVEIFQQTPHC